MVLPLNLAITAAEMSGAEHFPGKLAWMACYFSAFGEGISNAPVKLPRGSMLILNDRFPCQGHSPSLVAQQLRDIVMRFDCESVLLDFQRPGDAENEAMAAALAGSLPCPVAVSEYYASAPEYPVFLSPAPIHMPLEAYLLPWKGREIWLEAALCQESIAVTKDGTTFAPQFPPEGLEGGFFDNHLCCRYQTKITEQEVRFTLFDTLDSLQKKLEQAHTLGVKRFVGLFQELAPSKR